ncbi:MAG TPA: SDR family NAD(P)-dependent oxidoreductase [Armatimonadota bacterium]|jgi:NAD(P)-dependent dehydrogenase (short-subunit alcohol dehydrogenase family)
MLLQGKVALITGGGSGIGKATALLMAREGCKVAVLDRVEARDEETLAEIERGGGEGLLLAADVANQQEMEAAVGQVVARWGRLDIVFANAGINGVWAPLDELALAEWNETLTINLTGTFLAVRAALPALRERGGSVIITSSINGNRVFSNTGATAYSCSKAAQVAFAKMVALEVAKHKIRVNVICPGGIRTNIGQNTEQRDLEKVREPAEYPEGTIPLTDGGPGCPAQVARLVLFLASDASDLITGTEIYIDGAESLLQG